MVVMRAPVLILAVLLGGCATVTSVAVGPPQPPKPPDCALQFSQQPPEALAAGYQRVGEICLCDPNNPGNDPRASRSSPELQQRACALGGDLVTATGTCSAASPLDEGACDGIRFAVMKARAAAK